MAYQYATTPNTGQNGTVTVTASKGSPSVGTQISLWQYTLGVNSTPPPVNGYFPRLQILAVQSAGVIPGGGGPQQPNWQVPFSVSCDQPVQVGLGNVEDE